MDLKQLFNNNSTWVKNRLKEDDRYFERLSEGQSPKWIYFGCSDSRVIPEKLMGLEPGDLFVHRNISNLVNPSDTNAMSVLSYAIEHLKIDHVIVCGHYECGGVSAAMKGGVQKPIDSWLLPLTKIKDQYSDELNVISSDHERQRKLVELNVLEQCKNINQTEILREASKNREIQIHGWVFDISTGRIIDLNFKNS